MGRLVHKIDDRQGSNSEQNPAYRFSHYKIKDKEEYSMSENGKTQMFPIATQRELEIREILSSVYTALREKGYDPINQLVGYILSEDPTYITSHNNARALIRRLDRDEIMSSRIKNYLNITG